MADEQRIEVHRQMAILQNPNASVNPGPPSFLLRRSQNIVYKNQHDQCIKRGFFMLPPELRVKVYHPLFVDDKILQPVKFQPERTPTDDAEENSYSTVLLTCKKFFIEANGFIFKEAHISLKSLNCLNVARPVEDKNLFKRHMLLLSRAQNIHHLVVMSSPPNIAMGLCVRKLAIRKDIKFIQLRIVLGPADCGSIHTNTIGGRSLRERMNRPAIKEVFKLRATIATVRIELSHICMAIHDDLAEDEIEYVIMG
ncbi:hypothetical protein EJ08DRAFT_666093 [Tothia fuscella]|uniref:Uncharacterized protein n=1 Tax=Tothia fuscella TaxID=1048955 RepID=A0A9P4TT94_9PEZI|nr:hypothetical protein EJ08DRAFT_666093 [Tothia fuscella]